MSPLDPIVQFMLWITLLDINPSKKRGSLLGPSLWKAGLSQDYLRISRPCHPESSGLLFLRISWINFRLSQAWTVKR